MRELFDINLLSQIKGMDGKLSVSREQVTLKRQLSSEQRNKNRQQMAKKPPMNQRQETSGDDEQPTLNITV